jgi:mRNA interferase RelE/StbE
MAYTIETAPAVEKQLARLPKDIASRLADAIERLAVNPFPPGSKPLRGAEKGAYRIRIGDYRVVYEVYRKRLVVLVIKVGNRRDVYR